MILNNELLKVFPWEQIKDKAIHFFNIVLDILTGTIRQEKETIYIRLGKKNKTVIISIEIIMWRKILIIDKLLELKSKLSKVTR